MKKIADERGFSALDIRTRMLGGHNSTAGATPKNRIETRLQVGDQTEIVLTR
jgi:hypothetical protein